MATTPSNDSKKKLISLYDMERLVNAIELVHSQDVSLLIQEILGLDEEKASQEDLQAIETMLGGRSLRYVTQEEYDALPESEKFDDTIAWCILTEDGESINLEAIKKYVDDAIENASLEVDIDTATSDNLNTQDKTIVGAINELELEMFEAKADIIALDEHKLDLEDLPCYDTRITEKRTYTRTVSGTSEDIKISDDIYTVEEIKNFSNLTLTVDYMDDIASETYNCLTLSELDYSLIFMTDQSGDIGAAYIFGGSVCIVLKDTENTSAGIYLTEDISSNCTIEFSFDYLLSGEIKALDEKYLVNKPGRIVYTPCPDGCGNIHVGEIFNSSFNKACGAFSHAEGISTTANGMSTHAEGMGTKAIGAGSHAEGSMTEANGIQSHAEGNSTIANGDFQHVQGRYNVPLEDSYAHIVGNGNNNARSNAHTLDWNGNAWFAGKATVSVQPTDNNDLTTKLYVDQSISQANAGLQNQINELFQNVSSGKELIASAITDKGVNASEEETFQSLSEKINQIPVGPPGSNIIGYVNENNDIYVSLTELESGTYTLKFEDYTGLLNEFDDIGTVEV